MKSRYDHQMLANITTAKERMVMHVQAIEVLENFDQFLTGASDKAEC